jgi:hypothetical protein
VSDFPAYGVATTAAKTISRYWATLWSGGR